MELIELRNITKLYRLGEMDTPVLQGVSLTVSQGEFVALMGASGSGKTTLMNILGCLDHPTSGEYWLDGRNVVELSANQRAELRNQKIGFVFQNFNLLPRTSSLANVQMPLAYTSESLSEREARKRAEDLLRRVGLENRLRNEPSQLSGGQQQRVAIARSLVNRPSLLFADEPTGNLDSRTSEEVLRIFQELNEQEGVTIILVTHDENVARHARRIIRIRDGVIESDPDGDGKSHQLGESAQRSSSPGNGSWEGAKRSGGAIAGTRRMLKTALSGLRRNIFRAALTTLGIIIGVGAVIAMMEIGQGSSSSIQRSIASMGANILMIQPGTAASGGISFGAGSVMTLTPEDAEAVLAESPAIRGVAPVVRARTQVVYGNRNWVPGSIYGTTPAFFDVREWSLAQGEPFTDRDVRNASKICVIGQRLVKELFQDESPLEKEVRVNNVPFKVVGVLSSKGANMMGMDQDDILLAPWTTIKFRVTASSLTSTNQSASTTSTDSTQQTTKLSQVYPNAKNKLYPEQSTTQAANNPLPVRFTSIDQILAAARSDKEIPGAIQQINQILRERHRLQQGEPDDFYIRDMTEVTKTLSSTSAVMTKLLLAVALISLVVGGVGIMNIMLVSVTERTREIGLRMAVGARGRSILQQFLSESIMLCFCGGAAGILLGRGASYLVSMALHWPTELSVEAILAAFAVSVSVGVIFGFYPAWKASRLDPIIALRYE